MKKQIEALGVECWLPIHESRLTWAGKSRKVELPLCSSLLFVRCDEDTLRSLPDKLDEPSRVVLCDGVPARLCRKDVDSILELFGRASEDTPSAL